MVIQHDMLTFHELNTANDIKRTCIQDVTIRASVYVSMRVVDLNVRICAFAPDELLIKFL